ncbi:MAG: hypothetical protein AAGC57_05925 [Pseudomonadota bacterium]
MTRTQTAPAPSKPTLLIVSNEIKPAGPDGKFNARHAVRTLIEAGRASGFRIVAAPFDQFHFELRRSESQPRILLGTSMVRADAAIIRITGPSIAAARMLDRSLRAQGCVMLDPYERFSGSALGKAELLMQVQGKGCDSDRVIALTLKDLERRIRQHDFGSGLKLVVKPTDGYGGTMVRWVDGTEASIGAALDMARSIKGLMPPMIIEPALDVRAEYRVYTLDMEMLGAARRIAEGPDRPANASQGAELVEERPPQAVLDAIARVPTGGLIGWDVALTGGGSAIIIERNRPPSWRHFAAVSDVDISGAVVAHLKAKVGDHRVKGADSIEIRETPRA